jgi:tetratricopeptide (TPR) repeat protein
MLVVATVALYYPAEGHPFVNFDDNLYIADNVHVTSGLRWETVKWSFTTFAEGNWHPLTWLSHAADVQFYGLNPAGHHETNLILHALNVVLLFWVLQQATGYIGRSAMVAALFALHPINVETVVWVAERKNLLSMTFFLLALGAYRRYALKPGAGRYILVALLFALGLMAKSQVITFPFVLLLWDYWPLQRMFRDSKTVASLRDSVTFSRATQDSAPPPQLAQKRRELGTPVSLHPGLTALPPLRGSSSARTTSPAERKLNGRIATSSQRGVQNQNVQRSLFWLVVEKVPLFALAAVSAVITVKAQEAGHAFRLYPLSVRLGNAIVAYASYMKKAFWPVDLAPMYPHAGDSIAKWRVLAALLFLIVVTVFAFRSSLVALRQKGEIANSEERTANGALLVGWLWFVGTLVPMIGLVQVGTQAMADRYAYLPFIGLFIMVCWGVGEWAAQRQVELVWLRATAVAVLVALAWIAHQQIAYWVDNVTLWTRTLQVTRNNWVAEDNLGGALMEQGNLDAAVTHFRAAAAIYPGDPVSRLDIGFYEQEHKNWPQAIEQYQEVLRLTPSPKLRAEAYNNLALIDRDLGDYAAARDNFQSAVNISPRYVGAWVGLGLAAQRTGDLGAAIQAYSRAVEIQPSDLSYVLLARALEQAGRRDEAQAAVAQARHISGNFAETERTADRLLAQ